MQWEYALNERPPLLTTILLGLQWAFIAISSIVILGKIIGTFHFGESKEQILYLQKLFFLTGVSLFCQLLWGHQLPLISGPASVLLIGIVSSQGFQVPAIYTSIMIGGLFVGVLAATGLFNHFRKLFTARVISVVLFLIAFTLAPTVRNLMIDPRSGIDPLYNITFCISLTFVMFLLHKALSGIWKAALIMWSMVGGSIIYFLIFPDSFNKDALTHGPWLGFFFQDLITRPVLAPGLLISFLICYLALTINDLGSIQSLNELLTPAHKDRRITRGISLTGVANLVSGFLGIIGPVNYSLSPGVIASTRCASRYPLFPAAAFIILLSPFPYLIGLFGSVPSVVIAGVMIYILASQVSAALDVLLQECQEEGISFESGIIIGMPIMLGNVIAFLPTQVLESVPVMLRPVLGNGFVVGVVSALFLEHLVFKK